VRDGKKPGLKAPRFVELADPLDDAKPGLLEKVFRRRRLIDEAEQVPVQPVLILANSISALYTMAGPKRIQA
jgi:hypothetical protein